MESSQVTIVDYGMGNLWSVAHALRFLGAKSRVSKNPAEIHTAERLILPGVGSYFRAMHRLRATGLADALLEAVTARKSKILGICLGMQLMAERGSEDGASVGLGLIPGNVDPFSAAELGEQKTPHIGFNTVFASSKSVLLGNLSPKADFYFAHSYRMLPAEGAVSVGLCRHGIDFLASYERENIFAVQFHPEKSQTNGLQVLENFLFA